MPTIPTTMRAAAIDKFGDPEVLKLQTLPVPFPDPSEVLIEVDTAGVGPWDADIRGGWSPGGLLEFPYVLGYEGSGRVVSLGSRIHRFKIGDDVYAYSWNNPKGGFYAEYVAVEAKNVRAVRTGACSVTVAAKVVLSIATAPFATRSRETEAPSAMESSARASM